MTRYKWIETNMTANNAPSPLVATASSNYDGSTGSLPLRAFDGKADTFWGTVTSTLTGWVKLDFGVATKVDVFKVRANVTTAPKTFVLYGSNDDITYVELSNIANQTGWTGEERVFELGSRAEYRYYRLNVNSNNGNTYSTWVYELVFGTIFKDKFLISSNEKTYSLEAKTSIKYSLEMTSNTAPSPYVASASSEQSTFQAYEAFNTLTTTGDCWMTATNIVTGSIQIDYGEKRKINKLFLTSRNDSATASLHSPKRFQVLGSNDGVAFDTLGEFTEQTGWLTNETRVFDFKNENNYRYYRVNVLENNGGAIIAIGNITFGYENVVVKEIPSASEKNFIKYGLDSVDKLYLLSKGKNYILTNEETTPLENGKLFEHTIDTTKRQVKKITL